jgi:hypothetical protein
MLEFQKRSEQLCCRLRINSHHAFDLASAKYKKPATVRWQALYSSVEIGKYHNVTRTLKEVKQLFAFCRPFPPRPGPARQSQGHAARP